MKDEVIRASELGLYVFCARAWRLKADGYESQNKAAMEAGSEAHRAHGESVESVFLMRRWSIMLFIIAVLVLALWFFAR
jgi:hypothetical protein